MDLFDYVEYLAAQLDMVRSMPLRYVDPNKKRGRIYHVNVRFARSRAGQFLARHVTPRIDPWLYRATGGRYPASLPVVLSAPLMAKGARTGEPREVQLSYFHDGPDPILIASNYGGPKHPQWYYNLKTHPDCQFGDGRFVATEVTDPDERAPVRPRRAGLRRLRGLSREDGIRRASDPPVSPPTATGRIIPRRSRHHVTSLARNQNWVRANTLQHNITRRS
jgi:deazaflavin-dependent oxidoreductase (nitroreductase family)